MSVLSHDYLHSLKQPTILQGYLLLYLSLSLTLHYDLHLSFKLSPLADFFEFCCCFCINKEFVLISLLTLPFCRTFIKFFHLHIFETNMVSIVPLEHIFHTMCFFTEKAFLSSVIRLKFRYYNLYQAFISYNLILWDQIIPLLKVIALVIMTNAIIRQMLND